MRNDVMDIIKYTLEECEDILCRIRDGSIDDVDRVRVIEQMLKNGADKNDILERVGNLELALERKVSNSNNGLELVRMQMVRINNIGEYELSSEVKNKLSSIDGLLDNIGRLVKLEERIEMMAKPMARIERHSEIRRITGHSPNYRSDINDDIANALQYYTKACYLQNADACSYLAKLANKRSKIK